MAGPGEPEGAGARGLQGAAGAGAGGTAGLEGPRPPQWGGEGGGRPLLSPCLGSGRGRWGSSEMAPQTPLYRGMKPTWGTVMLPGGCLPKAAPLEGAGGPFPAGLSPTEGAGGAPGPGPDPASGVPGGAGEGVLPAGAQENEDHPGGERSMLGEPGQWGCLAGQAPTGCQAVPPNASSSQEPIPAEGSCQLSIPALHPPTTAALGEAPSLS